MGLLDFFSGGKKPPISPAEYEELLSLRRETEDLKKLIKKSEERMRKNPGIFINPSERPDKLKKYILPQKNLRYKILRNKWYNSSKETKNALHKGHQTGYRDYGQAA